MCHPTQLIMAPDVESSVVLVRRARDGDAEALNELLRRYLPRMRRWATGRLPPSARDLLDTGDIVQETLLKAVRNFGTIDVEHEGALQAYLRRALLNRLNDAYRRTATRPAAAGLDSGIASVHASPLEAAIGNEALQRYEAGLARLRDGDREAVILRVEFGYDYGRIAEMLGKASPDAARVAVSRALARLSREMTV
jgi:RNA polymerase sigma-70 factor (ECF subfamily)